MTDKVKAAQLPTIQRIKAVEKAARKAGRTTRDLNKMIDEAPEKERSILRDIADIVTAEELGV